MSKPIYLLCGVSGSGKTWVCEQLKDRFLYVRNDDYIRENAGNRLGDLMALATHSTSPVLTDCPFGERELRDQLVSAGYHVKPYFIVESTETVQARYLQRTGRPLPQAAATRSVSIAARADEWAAPRGTSSEVLQMLTYSWGASFLDSGGAE